MKNLLYKEFRLFIPAMYFGIALFAALLMLPTFPAVISVSFFVVSIYYIFSDANANRDIEFTLSLPITRKQFVAARHISIAVIQLVQILAAVIFAIAAAALHPEVNRVGLNVNIAFFGIVLLAYTVFNAFFLPVFFKTCYKVFLPMLLGMIGMAVVFSLAEAAVNIIPALKATLNTLNPETLLRQILLLAAGIIIYVAGLYLTYRKSNRNFDKVNL
jgi:hypothetical protein